MWQIPLNHLDTGTSLPCSLYNACEIGKIEDGNVNSVYNFFLNNFNKFYNDKKQPFGIYGTMAFFDSVHYVYRQQGKSPAGKIILKVSKITLEQRPMTLL